MNPNNIIATYEQTLYTLCQKHKVERLFAFGSVLRSDFDNGKVSDIDFLVEMPNNIDPLEKGQNLLDLWTALENLFKRRIDLITPNSLKNPYLITEINQHKQIIYEKRS